MFTGLDHLAVVVGDTEEALTFWRDRLGLPVLYSEKVNQGTVLLTHLDLGNTQLQLVEPLIDEHPLFTWLKENGSGLHHLCLSVNDIDQALEDTAERGLLSMNPLPHQGTQGKRAFFLNPSQTQNVVVEMTGP